MSLVEEENVFQEIHWVHTAMIVGIHEDTEWKINMVYNADKRLAKNIFILNKDENKGYSCGTFKSKNARLFIIKPAYCISI